jgi:Sec-independent protein translocase protein TatA
MAPAVALDGHRTLDLFEIALILAIALIVIGPERLPEVLRTTGKILRELRLASNTVLHELSDVMEEPPAKSPPREPIASQPEPPAQPSNKT